MNLFCERKDATTIFYRLAQCAPTPPDQTTSVDDSGWSSIQRIQLDRTIFAKVHETGNVVSFYLATYFTLVYNNTKYKTLSFFIPFHLALYICAVYLSTDCFRNIEPKDTSTNHTKLQPRILLFLYFFLPF